MLKHKKVLNVFLLAMMNVAIILSLRGIPLMAKEGVSMVFYLLFALLFFLIPTSLVSAELATGWPEEGGVFHWVSEAFGERTGFLAIWLQWFQNIFWYPTILAFAAGALAYFFLSPELATNPVFSLSVILVIYWSATWINMRGMQAAGWLSTTGAIIGTILPAVLIIIFGLIWWGTGGELVFLESGKSWLPDFSQFSNLSFLAGIILLFAGMEVNAVHVNDVKNPRRSYPLAIFISVIVIFLSFFFSSLAVAAVLPPSEISLTAGMMQGFAEFLSIYNMGWLLPIIGLLAAYGAIGSVAAWVVGPSKGMLATAKYGLIPPWLSHVNARGIPRNILITQGIIISLVSCLFLVTPTVGTAFFLLTDLAVILYLTMYILLFAAAIRLRYLAPKKRRPYKVPGGNWGIWVVGVIGILGALFAIFVGFHPPDQLDYGSPVFYITFLVVGTVIGVSLPFILYGIKKPSWKRKR
ncbi:MAG: Glutamate/gamma-aminobutyrate antiporter [Chlamydiae bacterium]|nr:Glutamate/gamma-aminobutyrate antiporter [Chlamydiota bacterium]